MQFNEVTEEDKNSPTKCPITTKLVLDMNEETNEPLIEVSPKLIKKLKPHQVEGTSFCNFVEISDIILFFVSND